MRSNIQPQKKYFAPFNRFALELPGQCVLDCSGPGDATEAVQHWTSLRLRGTPNEIKRPAECTEENLAAELKEFGAWDAEELANDGDNWERIVWIAAGNISEDSEPTEAE